MRNSRVILFLLLLFATASALSMTGFVSLLKDSDYVPPEENLIIVEITQDGVPIEKRLAEKADLFFSRAMRVKLLLGDEGISGYDNELIINLTNVSGRDLENISLIESIPKNIISSASLIRSEQDFKILEEDPIIKFSFKKIPMNATVKISYSSQQDSRIEETDFKEMPKPSALIKLEEGTCVGMTCNDFNPCTSDSCAGGECVFTELPDGSECGEEMVCQSNECIQTRFVEEQPSSESPAQDSGEIDENYLMIAVVLVALIAAAVLAKRVLKKRG